jgi:hypothetical protein
MISVEGVSCIALLLMKVNYCLMFRGELDWDAAPRTNKELGVICQLDFTTSLRLMISPLCRLWKYLPDNVILYLSEVLDQPKKYWLN